MRIAGIDIGSVSVAAVLIDGDGRILSSDYRFHRGEPSKALLLSLRSLGAYSVDGAAVTSSSPEITRRAERVDDRVALIGAARRSFGTVGSLLVVGAETFSIIHFGPDGSYRRLRTNSSCAAGTGSFLDQQAGRLSLEDSGELSRLALANRGEVPKIASRCAVFAKTDLIHAQAEGYSIGEICDGLCLGLARNIVDTLVSDEAPPEPVVFAGGVACNGAVTKHLEQLLGCPVLSDEHAPLYGAWGAALLRLESIQAEDRGRGGEGGIRLETIIREDTKAKEFFFPPLSLTLSDYPDFAGLESFRFKAAGGAIEVETDIYALPPGRTPAALFGIDIGSTSTKAALVSPEAEVYAGFYTRTAGNPIAAFQAILEAVRHVETTHDLRFDIRACATTGSGRSFIGKIAAADLVVDEITAHARAAYELDPDIDTIIEIGGQDSKFTTMRNGMVTFSQMNTICAAGTGSFIEEQAARLNVPLSEYGNRAAGRPAPLASDRCTVFMERDINNYLNGGYSVDEVLAAALFSVRENYLQKVAGEAHIGNRVCFQGATAKNRALVAAFEQKLKRPVFVSKFCHLTGALGAALIAGEEHREQASSFRGMELFGTEIPVRTEICGLCANHCRIRIAEVRGETVAFGFLCGRDYGTNRYVEKNSSGFDLLKSRRAVFRDESGKGPAEGLPVIGLPAGLHMAEQLPFWRRFFGELGFPVVDSAGMKEPIRIGKTLTGAEFCAPMAALHGHADYIASKADLMFLPLFLDAPKRSHEEGALRRYCYYTQYAPGLIKAVIDRRRGMKVLSPLIKPGSLPRTIVELSRLLSPWLNGKSAVIEVARSWSAASRRREAEREELKELYLRETAGIDDIHVVLLGRPYTVLSPGMNNRIPEIFGSLGVKCFYQDMLPGDEASARELSALLSSVHWHFAADILEAAAAAAARPGAYPVYITSFKCAPDSFAIDYFRRILESKEKPYLILQLDEHDSSVGYETRIEAGIRSFRNHAARTGVCAPREPSPRPFITLPTFIRKQEPNPYLEKEIGDKVLLYPDWDPVTAPLLAANLRREGYDARLLPESVTAIRKSMRLNSGQCLPVSIVAQEAMDYVRDNGIDPAKAVLWIARAKLACNITAYPLYLKNIFETEGGGMEKLGVYVGDISHMELGPKTAIYTYYAYMFGGLLRKLGCRIRPYEVHPGETDAILKEGLSRLETAFLAGTGFDEAVARTTGRLEAVERSGPARPKVAIFGDLYVRDNDVMNQDLVRTIEEAGGEVITTPYNEYAKIISRAYFHKWIKNGDYLQWLKNRSLLAAAALVEKKYYAHFREFFDPPEIAGGEEAAQRLARFNLNLEHDGESMENILKIFHILEEHRDVALFVQTSPSYCCPALVTEAMSRDIERISGVPVVSITYDGTGTPQNHRVVPYIHFRTGFSGE